MTVGAQFVESSAQAAEIFVPGHKIHLAVDGRGRKTRVVVFVEELSQDHLILSVHQSEQTMLALQVGQEVELGIGLRVARMHFICTAQITRIDGTRVILTRPSQAKKQPRRAFARVAYAWPVRATLSDGTVLNGETCNISASGALIQVEGVHELRVDMEDQHAVVITGADGREYQSNFKIVRTIHEVGKTSIAIHFYDLPEVQRVHLELQVLRGIARRYLRVAVNLGCRVDLSLGERKVSFKGTTENACGGGALIRSTESHEVEANMRGSVTFNLYGELMTLHDVVVLRTLDPKDTGLRLVVEFDKIDYEDRLHFVEFLMLRLEVNSNV